MARRKTKELSTPSGIPLKRIYTKEDVEGGSPRDLSDAGQYPFTRGIYPEMYRQMPWVIQAEAGFDSVEETRSRGEFLRSIGVSHYKVPTFDIYFDLVTNLGHDPDKLAMKYLVGKEGVHVNSIRDMEELLRDIDLGGTHVALISCAAAPPLFAMLVGTAEKREIPIDRLFGSMFNNPLLGPLGENYIVHPPRAHLRIMLDVIEFCMEKIPRYQPLSISTYDVREMGATAVEEIAIGLAMAAEILTEAGNRGLDIDAVASRMHIQIQAGDCFFEEIAKLRALRRMWAGFIRDRFGAKDPKSCRAKFQIHTQGSSLQAKEPLNNAVRAGIHTLAAVLGGVQVIHTCSYDEAYALPTEDSVRLSVRTQQIIAEETGVSDVVDPLGGAYYVESLTDEIEARAWEFLDEIENMGGYIAGLENGFLINRITTSALEVQKRIDRGEKVIVGVNKYVSDEPPAPIDLFQHSPDTSRRVLENVARLREERDVGKTEEALSHLRETLINGGNTIRPMIEAAKAYATLGEIMGTCKEVLGEYVPSV